MYVYFCIVLSRACFNCALTADYYIMYVHIHTYVIQSKQSVSFNYPKCPINYTRSFGHFAGYANVEIEFARCIAMGKPQRCVLYSPVQGNAASQTVATNSFILYFELESQWTLSQQRVLPGNAYIYMCIYFPVGFRALFPFTGNAPGKRDRLITRLTTPKRGIALLHRLHCRGG